MIAGFKARNHPQQTRARGADDATDDRGTAPELFGALDREFHFDLDVAASPQNAKCARFYTIGDDGLAQPWNGRVWCNPPFSSLRPWVEKARAEILARRAELVVMLLPANRTEQSWWQDLVERERRDRGGTLEVRFLAGRLRFDRPNWTPPAKGDRPPFGCCLLIFRSDAEPDQHQGEDAGEGRPSSMTTPIKITELHMFDIGIETATGSHVVKMRCGCDVQNYNQICVWSACSPEHDMVMQLGYYLTLVAEELRRHTAVLAQVGF